MTPEAQRIAIAEVCGWKSLPLGFAQEVIDAGYMIDPKNNETYVPPNYLSDLNAMHEAEKVLSYEQLPIYISILKNPVLMKDEGVSDFDIVHATAAQRAEAFLRTLNLWK